MALPPQSLAGKVAIVTGGSRGIGATIAVDLARRGAHVCITYTSESSKAKCEALASEVSKLPNSTRLMFVQADAANEDSPPRVVSEVIGVLGDHIDILVNNAAVEFSRAVSETTKADFDKHFHTNVLGPLLMTKAVLPHLRNPGRIINMSSVGARMGIPEIALYCSSKAAVEGLTKCMAAELGGKGTTVNAIAPGPVKSEMLDQIPKDVVDGQIAATAVEKRVGETQEIADVIAWLASSEASWVSGQTISVSGGFSMY